MNYKKDSLSDEISHRVMILLVEKDKTKFTSYEQLINDSLYVKYQQKKSSSFRKYDYDYDFMTIANNRTQEISKFKLLGIYLYELSTPISKLNWQIQNDTRKIGKFSCQKATLDFCGRKWEAWFTKEIPLNEGPYIFKGLPGLILSLKDSEGDYEFIFSGIQKSSADSIDDKSMKSLPVKEVQLEKVSLEYYNDPYKELKSGAFGSYMITSPNDPSPKKPDFNKMAKEKQESIRKENNPIELCKAIKYP
ncbi:hypothetical protein GCM10023210_10090 [Chryseobacterium ginsengisoli]|uniref:GLPGLI family protein n=2 Tax=Chryseobacterium ginsengisoli TaxID=363853 RepID=A0ABP9M144_9FLAO